MGGFLAPDPMNGFTNCMHAFAFIRPTRKETQRVQKPRLRSRGHISSSKNAVVVPSRQRSPFQKDSITAAVIPNQRNSLRHPTPPSRPSRGRKKLCKKPTFNKSFKGIPRPVAFGSNDPSLDIHSLTPPPLPPRPTITVEPVQQIVLQTEEAVAASPVVAVSVNPFDDGKSLHEPAKLKQTHSELPRALSALRPRLPHQRMHFLCRLGDGGEGHIDLFRLHCPPQTLLAIKTLKRTPDLIFHKNKTRKPLEAHILQDLLPTPHPHIVQMFGYTCTPRKTMMIYEYCSLGDLQDVLESHFKRQALIPEGFIWHIYLAVAKALAYLHTGYITPSHHLNSPANSDADSLALLQKFDEPWTPILHRDIKPENIFLRPSPSPSSPYPTPLLADFGLATHRTPKPYECSGTFTYQGPEIPTQTAASDLWSLGATIHAMAHGRPPMIPKSENRSTESWEWDPRSRKVKDVEERGYSMHLGVLMRAVLRRRMEERVGGKRLVRLVEVGRREWGGDDVRMEEWAFRGLEGKEEGEFKIRGAAGKPWKRGP
ncbi:MAG: hypothetical protein Q9176_005838 [Flavoplaca citrina]